MTFKALKAVFAGDTIRVTVAVKEKHPPKEGKGKVVLASTARNQRNEVVMEAEGTFLVRVRGMAT